MNSKEATLLDDDDEPRAWRTVPSSNLGQLLRRDLGVRDLQCLEEPTDRCREVDTASPGW